MCFLVEEILVREIVLSPCASVKRFSIAQFLEVIQPARNAPIGAHIVGVEVKACSAVNPRLQLVRVDNRLTVGVYDSRFG